MIVQSDQFDHEKTIEESPDRLLAHQVHRDNSDTEDSPGSPDSPGDSPMDRGNPGYDEEYEHHQQHHFNMMRARRRLLDLFLSHGNSEIRCQTGDQDQMNTTASRSNKSRTETQVQIQQMIYDKIQRSNKRKVEKQIDVYSLDNLKCVATSDKGLPQRVIDSIITNTFYRCNLTTNDPSKLECSICCVEFQDGDQIKILQCLHTHHKACVDQWFIKKSTCPDCKFNMRSINVSQLC